MTGTARGGSCQESEGRRDEGKRYCFGLNPARKDMKRKRALRRLIQNSTNDTIATGTTSQSVATSRVDLKSELVDSRARLGACLEDFRVSARASVDPILDGLFNERHLFQ